KGRAWPLLACWPFASGLDLVAEFVMLKVSPLRADVGGGQRIRPRRGLALRRGFFARRGRVGGAVTVPGAAAGRRAGPAGLLRRPGRRWGRRGGRRRGRAGGGRPRGRAL